jgi:hypothetical protein
MADQGSVSRLSSGAVSGFSGNRTIDGTAQSRSAVSVSGTSGQGVGRREVPDRGNRQTVNFEGKVLNRAAPRGTYLNIIV